MLGILMLDTGFPRVVGDLGNPATFAFPVRHAIVAGASVARVVPGDDSLLPDFVAAARALEAQGCRGITTTCGFLVRHQAALADAVRVPVMTSALLQLPLVARTLGRGRRAGVVTYSADDLDATALAAAGADPSTPCAGLDPRGYLARAIRDGCTVLDQARARADAVDAATRLLAAHPDVAAIVLECTNLPPYRHAVQQAVALPVFDAAQLVAWFHAGLADRAARAGSADPD